MNIELQLTELWTGILLTAGLIWALIRRFSKGLDSWESMLQKQEREIKKKKPKVQPEEGEDDFFGEEEVEEGD